MRHRQLLAAWLAVAPAQPALAQITPAPPEAALCHAHECRCRRTPAAREAAPRSCHRSEAGFMSAACDHDPETAVSATGSAPYLMPAGSTVDAPAHFTRIRAPRAPDAAGDAPGVDPPPPKAAAS
jgi:hypothetical protein